MQWNHNTVTYFEMVKIETKWSKMQQIYGRKSHPFCHMLKDIYKPSRKRKYSQDHWSQNVRLMNT